MGIRLGLTFDDVLLEPRKTAVKRGDANVETRLTKQARLAIPLLSAASDTVSDARFAIALGKLGGMAVLHRNCSLEEQVRMVKEVKQVGLPAGAAVGPLDVKRAVALSEAGASFIFIDCSHAPPPPIILSPVVGVGGGSLHLGGGGGGVLLARGGRGPGWWCSA